jgi:hypothetical protein
MCAVSGCGQPRIARFAFQHALQRGHLVALALQQR